jgi:hypothetical protein
MSETTTAFIEHLNRDARFFLLVLIIALAFPLLFFFAYLCDLCMAWVRGKPSHDPINETLKGSFEARVLPELSKSECSQTTKLWLPG